MRSMTLVLVCFATAPATHAAVYQYPFQSLYDPACAETSNVTEPAELVPAVTLKFKQPTDLAPQIDAVRPSDLLVQAPAAVPSTCGKPFLGTPAQVVMPPPQAEFNAESNAPTSPAEVSPLAPSGMPSYSALDGVPAAYSGVSSSLGFAVIDSTEVPEPSSLAIFGLGLAAIAAAMQFQQRQSTGA